MTVVYSILKLTKSHVEEESLNRKDTPYVILMIVLDILAPILLMSAIAISDASSVSLMNNFEIVATSIIAFIIFKERISIKLWIGIILVTIASIILSIDFTEGIKLNLGSLLALLACACWGLENNCTRKISDKNPFQIVILKGIFSGLGSVFIGLILKEHIGNSLYIIYALILGFVAYGLSVFMYVKAQHTLGVAKTSVFYSPCTIFRSNTILYYFKKHTTLYLLYCSFSNDYSDGICGNG